MFYLKTGCLYPTKIKSITSFYLYITTTSPFCQATRSAEYITVIQTSCGKVFAEKLGSCGAAGAECATSAQFIRPARELYGLRYKRRTKHLPKSTVILHLAFSNILLRSSAKKSRRFLCVLHKEIYVMFFWLIRKR